MVRVLIIGLALISLSFVFTVSCQSSGSSSPTTTPTLAPDSATVEHLGHFSGASFFPRTITVLVGTTVTWNNNDTMDAHTVTSDSGLFDGSILIKDVASPLIATFSYTFTERGTFSYHCSDHPDVTGKVIVE